MNVFACKASGALEYCILIRKRDYENLLMSFTPETLQHKQARNTSELAATQFVCRRFYDVASEHIYFLLLKQRLLDACLLARVNYRGCARRRFMRI
jgi:hypothetical protein